MYDARRKTQEDVPLSVATDERNNLAYRIGLASKVSRPWSR